MGASIRKPSHPPHLPLIHYSICIPIPRPGGAGFRYPHCLFRLSYTNHHPNYPPDPSPATNGPMQCSTTPPPPHTNQTTPLTIPLTHLNTPHPNPHHPYIKPFLIHTTNTPLPTKHHSHPSPNHPPQQAPTFHKTQTPQNTPRIKTHTPSQVLLSSNSKLPTRERPYIKQVGRDLGFVMCSKAACANRLEECASPVSIQHHGPRRVLRGNSNGANIV